MAVNVKNKFVLNNTMEISGIASTESDVFAKTDGLERNELSVVAEKVRNHHDIINEFLENNFHYEYSTFAKNVQKVSKRSQNLNSIVGRTKYRAKKKVRSLLLLKRR